MNKKILIVSALEPWSMKNNVGAPSLYETLKGYSSSGYEVTYLTFHKDEKIKNESHAHNIDPLLKNLVTIRVNKKSAPTFLGSRIGANLNRTFLHPKSLYRGAKKFLEEQDISPSIIYCYEEQGIYAVSLLKKKLKENSLVVHRIQGTILGNKFDNIIHCLRKYVSFRALRLKADKYIMTNDGTFGDKALKYWNKEVNDKNLLFVRNGFNFQQFSGEFSRSSVLKDLGLNLDGVFAFTVSRLTYWKRVDRAIELIYKLHKAYPNLNLLIVGDGEYKESLEQLVKERNIENNVRFLGALGREKVAELMSCMDIFLSLYDVSNLGNPLFEALISGQCVLTLDNGTTAEVIKNENNGIIVDPTNFDKLEKEFEELVASSEKRERLGKSAKKWADENLYSWKDRMLNEINWLTNS